MSTVAINKENSTRVTIVKKMRDYNNEPAFKKKAENAIAFLKKHEMPKAINKKKK